MLKFEFFKIFIEDKRGLWREKLINSHEFGGIVEYFIHFKSTPVGQGCFVI